jgi:hypothetical protein
MSAKALIRKSDVTRAVKAAQDLGVGIAGIELRPDGSVFLRAGKPLDKDEPSQDRPLGLRTPEQVMAELREWAK